MAFNRIHGASLARAKLLRWSAGVIVLLSLLMAVPRTASAATLSEVKSDANWILSAQLSDGAIADYIDQRTILPYVANYAAIGLAKAAKLTADTRYSSAVWRWLRWYQGHEARNGFVTDYNVVNGAEVSSGTMDSTDAYAGTFLSAVQAVYNVTGDRSQLTALKTGIAGAVNAIKATQDADGLTWAKPTWHVKYLMDQGETWAGLRAASNLALALNNRTLANSAAVAASRLQTGVQGLWNPSLGAYDWAVHSNGVHHTTDWATLYPDAMEQAWPVALGLVTGTRAQVLMAHFAAAQPSWNLPLAQIASGTSTVGYWPMTSWSFAQIGGLATAAGGLTQIRNAALAANRSWPFTTADAGEILALSNTSAAGVSWPFTPTPAF
jgi:hypothetical protein